MANNKDNKDYYDLHRTYCFVSAVNVSLGSSSANVSENVGNITVCVTLTASANTERQFTVLLNTESGTATGMYLNIIINVTIIYFNLLVTKLP